MIELRSTQKEALELLEQKGHGYLAMSMGLGKTRVALTWAKSILPKLNGKGILVLAPLLPCYTTWPDETKKWSSLTYTILHGPNKNQKLLTKKNLYFVNYDGLLWLYNTLIKWPVKTIPFNALIADEAANLKDHKTNRFKALLAMRSVFKNNIVLMSGRPRPQSVVDLWSQYALLDGGARLLPKISHFRSAFCTYDIYKKKYSVSEENQKRIADRIKDITYVAETCPDMPESVIIDYKCILPADQWDKYNELLETFILTVDNAVSIIAKSQAIKNNKLRQFIQGAVYNTDEFKVTNTHFFHKTKLLALKELIQSTDTPILCAIQYKFEVEMIKAEFPDASFIVGGMSAAEKQQLTVKWNKREIPLLACHPRSMYQGLNMQTGSNIIVWLSLPWSCEQYEQFNARLVRPGQQNKVIIYRLLIDKTVDMSVAAALHNRIFEQTAFLQYIRNSIKEGI